MDQPRSFQTCLLASTLSAPTVVHQKVRVILQTCKKITSLHSSKLSSSFPSLLQIKFSVLPWPTRSCAIWRLSSYLITTSPVFTLHTLAFLQFHKGTKLLLLFQAFSSVSKALLANGHMVCFLTPVRSQVKYDIFEMPFLAL